MNFSTLVLQIGINLNNYLTLKSRLYCFLLAMLFAPLAYAKPEILLMHTGLTANELAIIINDEDEQSRSVGEYYQKARHIPVANVIHVRFPSGTDVLDPEEFLKL